ncbi:MAG TPA: MarR family transcriptional regulator, partial [Planctomycetaceae bacterium]|nr:MarR family transcriptional regulator [Planctomycetaceae bacterium]
MAAYDFEESLGYWLTITTQAWHRTMIDRLAPDGITYRQMHVIGWLKFDGELSQAELARKMMIEPPTLVRILDRMEEAGLLQRI